jgi:hypothetical protein
LIANQARQRRGAVVVVVTFFFRRTGFFCFVLSANPPRRGCVPGALFVIDTFFWVWSGRSHQGQLPVEASNGATAISKHQPGQLPVEASNGANLFRSINRGFRWTFFFL